MRLVSILIFVGATVLMGAEQGTIPNFVSASELSALIAKAKAERKPDQINFTQPLVKYAPYRASFESRIQGKPTNPNIHETDTEIVYVVDGAGMLTMGGTLKDERRVNDANRTGSAIAGGVKRHIGKGDFFIVPEGTAHAFTDVEGTLVIISLHGPKGTGVESK
jgi:mannose-6-phosphate isomerase-like protein (cupin superfamily)